MLRAAVFGVVGLILAACSGVTAPPTSAPPSGPTSAPIITPTSAPTATPGASATTSASGGTTAELCGIDWTTSAATCGGVIGDRFLFQCPPGGRDSGIYGTDTYTDDSFVCVAAVHVGLISIAAGGPVTIELTPGLSAYVASTRNGVESYGYSSWPTSFVFVDGPVAGPTPGATPDMPPGDPLVLAHIPPAFKVNCHAVTTFAAGEIAAVQCAPPQVTGYVTYVLFEDENTSLDAWFSDFDYFAAGVEGSDCAAGPCIVGWIGTNGLVEGRYFANTYTGIHPNGLIAKWFDAYERIMAGLVVYDTTFAELYDMALQAGPIH